MNEEAAKPDALLWLDFETTGIDRASSLPLEVGMECTDVLGEQSFGSLTRIIRPASLDLLDMSPVAFSMHTDNGLLFELLNSSFRNDSIGAVANAVEEYLDSLSQRFTLIPTGTNVDFDMAFLARLNLRPSAWLSYRKFDLTALAATSHSCNARKTYTRTTKAHTEYATASNATSTTTGCTANS